MNILFLDIDGVLNNEHTKELSVTGFRGLDLRLVKLFKDWFVQKEGLNIVLSSTWRTDPIMAAEVAAAGIPFVDHTPVFPRRKRGDEIANWTAQYQPERYAILDDTAEFAAHQLPFFVQTSPVHGLRLKDLKRLDKILGG